MKTSKNTGDATSSLHDRLMIENELEEASLFNFVVAQLYGMLGLCIISKNQIKNREAFKQNNL